MVSGAGLLTIRILSWFGITGGIVIAVVSGLSFSAGGHWLWLVLLLVGAGEIVFGISTLRRFPRNRRR